MSLIYIYHNKGGSQSTFKNEFIIKLIVSSNFSTGIKSHIRCLDGFINSIKNKTYNNIFLIASIDNKRCYDFEYEPNEEYLQIQSFTQSSESSFCIKYSINKYTRKKFIKMFQFIIDRLENNYDYENSNMLNIEKEIYI